MTVQPPLDFFVSGNRLINLTDRLKMDNSFDNE